MALYVADIYEADDTVEHEGETPVYPPGMSVHPDFGFIVGEGVLHKVIGSTALDALKVVLDATKPSVLSLCDPGGSTTEKLTSPDIEFSALKNN